MHIILDMYTRDVMIKMDKMSDKIFYNMINNILIQHKLPKGKISDIYEHRTRDNQIEREI